jgi:hypothetical protein
MEIRDHDDGYQWLDNYGRGRLRRRLNWLLKKRQIAWWIGLGFGISLGFILLPYVAELAP